MVYAVAAVFVIGWAWLNVLASFAVHHDATLERTQKIAQLIVVWLIPYLGGAVVLHLIWQHCPSAIPGAWVPWPFKKLIYGRTKAPNPNRDEDSWAALSWGKQHHHRGDGFGGDD